MALMAGAGPLDRPKAFEALNAMDHWLPLTSARRPRLADVALRRQERSVGERSHLRFAA